MSLTDYQKDVQELNEALSENRKWDGGGYINVENPDEVIEKWLKARDLRVSAAARKAAFGEGADRMKERGMPWEADWFEKKKSEAA